jgi:hypothetical protein
MKMRKILALGMAALTINAFANPVFASNLETVEAIQLIEDGKAPREVLHTAYNISVDNSTYTSGNFATPSSNSNKINVSFTNDGTSSAIVKLYKVGSSKDTLVGSFTVKAGSSDYESFSASSGTTYYIKITNSSGAGIKGSLKVRQLD